MKRGSNYDISQLVIDDSNDPIQERLHLAVTNWDEEDDNPPINIESLPEQPIIRLQAHNYNLWHYESEVRDCRDNPHRTAELKQHIDNANKARNRAIQHVDEQLDHQLDATIFWDRSTDAAKEYELNSQTVGQIVDRLSVLVLKEFYTRKELNKPTTGSSRASECRRRITSFQEQSTYIQHCLDRFVDKLERGSAKMRPYEEMKFYEDADLTTEDSR